MKHTRIGSLYLTSQGRVWLIYGFGPWIHKSRSIWDSLVQIHISTTSHRFLKRRHTYVFVKVRLTRLRSILFAAYLPWACLELTIGRNIIHVYWLTLIKYFFFLMAITLVLSSVSLYLASWAI